MIEFKQVADRIFSILKNKIRNEVFVEDYIDYPQLEKYLDYLKFEPLLKKNTLPIIISLSESFHDGENIDGKIKELCTYQSMFDRLIECEIIKRLEQVNNEVKYIKSEAQFEIPIFDQFPEYEIINIKEFNEFIEEVRKGTIIYITHVKISSYIRQKLDEISKQGQYGASRVSVILRDVQSPMVEFTNLIDNQYRESEGDESGLSETPKEVFTLIKDDLIDSLFEALKAFFEEEVHDKLKLLFKSQTIDSKVVFKGSCKRLCYPFRQLHLHSLLTNQKKFTINWICNNFNYMYKGEVKECSLGNVKNYLTKSEISFPKNIRIKIDSLEHLD